MAVLPYVLASVIAVAVVRTIVTRNRPYIRPLDESTRHAYLVLALLVGFLILRSEVYSGRWRLTSFDMAGFKGQIVEEVGKQVANATTDIKQDVTNVKSEVDQLSEQIRNLYASRISEIFDRSNWSRLRFSEYHPEASEFWVSVPLGNAPIPESLVVVRFNFTVPYTDIKVSGKTIRFITTGDKNEDLHDRIVVSYHPQHILQAQATKNLK